MRTQKSIQLQAWAQAAIKTLTTEEILERLDRLRTYYLLCWEATAEAGTQKGSNQYYSFISRITNLLDKIEKRQVQADVEVAKTIMAYPLMLADSEELDFSHLLEGFNGGVKVC